jgi:F-type H+-transporting ATPase subunit gamma
MESLDLIKSRIQSISSTRQIMQSMRLVASSKVMRVRAQMLENRPFLSETERLIRIAAQSVSDSRRNRYLTPKALADAKAAVIVVSGDRGLCGGYNIHVSRRASELIRSLERGVRIVAVGEKARDYCRRRYSALLAGSFAGVSESPLFSDAEEIAALVKGWYDGGEVDALYLVYTRFENMLIHTPVSERLLPLSPVSAESSGKQARYRCEPGGDTLLSRGMHFYLSSRVFGALLESSSCMQSAQVASMDVAVKNADEMISKLVIEYNQVRQGAITQEIIEIAGGSEAV